MGERVTAKDYRLEDGTLSLDVWRQTHEVDSAQTSENKVADGLAKVSLLRLSENTFINRFDKTDYFSGELSADQGIQLLEYLEDYQRQDLEDERLYIFELAANLVSNGVAWDEVLKQIDLCAQHLPQSTSNANRAPIQIQVFTNESVANLNQ